MQVTPYPAVNALLERLLCGVREVLGNQFVGLYLHGSLAAGDFDPARSDIDFLVATRTELPAETVASLAAFHRAVKESDLTWATNFEGSYIPLKALRRHDPDHAVYPCVQVDGSFGLERHGIDWVIQRHLIREKGLTLVGPDPKTLIAPVSAEELRVAARRILREWWAPMLGQPFRLKNSEYQAYAVITMCRILYTVEYGAVVSKPQAGRWAQERLGSPWDGLIARAMEWRHGVHLDCAGEALALVAHTLTLCP